MPVKKTDSSETLRTTDSMKRRAHLCSRFVISLMKLFRLCGKSKRKPKADVEKIQKNTTWCFFARKKNFLCFFTHPPISFPGFSVFSPACLVSSLRVCVFSEASPFLSATWCWLPSSPRGGVLALWSHETSFFVSCERAQTSPFVMLSYWNC